MTNIYLDYAAATPVDHRVLSAMQPFFSETFYNPSALYAGAREAKVALSTARSTVARLIGAKPSEIIFTAGGTESVNLAIHGVMHRYPEATVITSAIEHDAVRETAKKYNAVELPVDTRGIVRTEKLEKLITDSTVLISVMMANNEIGTIQPIKEIVAIVNSIRKDRLKAKNTLPLFVHTDACQAPLYMDVNVSRLGVDLMTLNGGKMYGPKQSGILYKKSSTQLEPLISGGGQEWGLRSGTENVAFAIGFAKALELADSAKMARVKAMTKLREYFIDGLISRYDGQITGHLKHRLANNIHVQFEGVDNERVLFALDDNGVAAATGSACSASSDVSSHVLLALGKNNEYARSSLRFSLGRDSTTESIDSVLDILDSALRA